MSRRLPWRRPVKTLWANYRGGPHSTNPSASATRSPIKPVQAILPQRTVWAGSWKSMENWSTLPGLLNQTVQPFHDLSAECDRRFPPRSPASSDDGQTPKNITVIYCKSLGSILQSLHLPQSPHRGSFRKDAIAARTDIARILLPECQASAK
jgi:hypothetical protein